WLSRVRTRKMSEAMAVDAMAKSRVCRLFMSSPYTPMPDQYLMEVNVAYAMLISIRAMTAQLTPLRMRNKTSACMCCLLGVVRAFGVESPLAAFRRGGPGKAICVPSLRAMPRKGLLPVPGLNSRMPPQYTPDGQGESTFPHEFWRQFVQSLLHGRDMSQTDTNVTSETLGFQAEVKQLLHLMIHSLYSNREIFLR